MNKIHYNLYPAVKRGRQSFPNYVGGNSRSGSVKNKYMLKRNSCSIHYNLSPAVKRRRQSLPNYVGGNSGSGSVKNKYMLKRNSCSVA
ncbi:hypothetical protein J6590_043381 [Homalodisca vitripennis]|nr:hypothetical protein J6590_043381 [Homalodisca vitripennis]